MKTHSMVIEFLYVTVRHDETNRCIFATFCCNCIKKGYKYKNISEVQELKMYMCCVKQLKGKNPEGPDLELCETGFMSHPKT
jgi:hypothetical protein